MELIRAQDRDTICALSTPPGHGGIAVIRVSGSDAEQITRKICSHLPQNLETHKIYFTSFVEPGSRETVDEGLVSYFKEGRSYTGEETCEISCHGGQTVSQVILNNLIQAGARIAEPGEFTYRSFLNGNLDLAQAESVLDLIESQSPKSAKLAVRNLQGELSKTVVTIKSEIEWMLAHLEASIDFSTEDIEVVDHDEVHRKATEILDKIDELTASYESGRIVKEGLHIGLVGHPNVGKSSLLNTFLKEDRAIVTDEPGTTRDVIEGSTMINGQRVFFMDTAGLRVTDNKVEKIGIDRTHETIKKLDHIFIVVNDDAIPEISEFNVDLLNSESISVIVNKVDLKPENLLFTEWSKNSPEYLKSSRVFPASVKTGQGLPEIEKFIEELSSVVLEGDGAVLTNARHFNSLSALKDHLVKAMELMRADQSPEFVAFELQDCQRHIYDVLGLQVDEQIIDRIFKEFCLGK